MYDLLFWIYHLATALAAPSPYEKHISSGVYHIPLIHLPFFPIMLICKFEITLGCAVAR